MNGRHRLVADLLTDCVAQLRAKTEECDALRLEVASLKVKFNSRAQRLSATIAEEFRIRASIVTGDYTDSIDVMPTFEAGKDCE